MAISALELARLMQNQPGYGMEDVIGLDVDIPPFGEIIDSQGNPVDILTHVRLTYGDDFIRDIYGDNWLEDYEIGLIDFSLLIL